MTDLEIRAIAVTVIEEIRHGRFHEGIWSTCQAKAQGDHEDAMARYMSQRLRMLLMEHLKERRRNAWRNFFRCLKRPFRRN